MSQDFIILTIFTVISQMAAGSFIFREVSIIYNSGGSESAVYSGKSLPVILVLLVFSILISFLHLGNPSHAINAINNLKSSWLSRELLFISLFTLSLAVLYIFEKSGRYGLLIIILRIISLLTCLFFLYSMTRLYMLPSIRSWYHPSTPVAFIISTLICGLTLFPALNIVSPGFVYKRMYPLLFALVLFSLVNSGIYYNHISGNQPVTYLLRICIPSMAILIIPVLNFRQLLNKYSPWTVILFLMLLTGEFLGRIIFFLSFAKSGL